MIDDNLDIYFNNPFNENTIMKRYSTKKINSTKFDFVGVIRNLFDSVNLEEIHQTSTEEYKELFEIGKDSSTIFHERFYNKYRAGWAELETMYQKFIEKVVYKYFDEDFLYQSFPTFRVMLPSNVAVGAFHNDGDFGHPDGEVNFIIPLTNSSGTASVWVESKPGKKDFAAMNMKVGNLITFNGNKLTHGNKVNDTGRSRVSMDFRVLPISKYNPENESESVTTHTKYREGAYYKRFTK